VHEPRRADRPNQCHEEEALLLLVSDLVILVCLYIEAASSECILEIMRYL
jgi:hypothetical protein